MKRAYRWQDRRKNIRSDQKMRSHKWNQTGSDQSTKSVIRSGRKDVRDIEDTGKQTAARNKESEISSKRFRKPHGL